MGAFGGLAFGLRRGLSPHLLTVLPDSGEVEERERRAWLSGDTCDTPFTFLREALGVRGEAARHFACFPPIVSL